MQSRHTYEISVAGASKTELLLSEEPAAVPDLQSRARLERRRPGPPPARAYDDRPRRVLALTSLRTRRAVLATICSLTHLPLCGTTACRPASLCCNNSQAVRLPQEEVRPLPRCSKDVLKVRCARQVRCLCCGVLCRRSTSGWAAHHSRGYAVHSTWLGVVRAVPQLCSHAPCACSLCCSSLRLLTPGTHHVLQFSTPLLKRSSARIQGKREGESRRKRRSPCYRTHGSPTWPEPPAIHSRSQPVCMQTYVPHILACHPHT